MLVADATVVKGAPVVGAAVSRDTEELEPAAAKLHLVMSASGTGAHNGARYAAPVL